MKKLIKWLSDISGVTKETRRESFESVGRNLLQDSYWFNGGITYNYPLNDVQNFCILYGEQLQQGNYYPSISPIRDELYKCHKNNINLQTDREVYGYVLKDSYHFVAVENFEKESKNPKSPIFGKKREDFWTKMRVKE